MDYPPETGQHNTSPLRKRTSSIPRPTPHIEAEDTHAGSYVNSATSPPTSTSTSLNHYKTRRPDFYGGAFPKGYTATPTIRAASASALKSTNSPSHGPRPRPGDTASFRDLVARFNQNPPQDAPYDQLGSSMIRQDSYDESFMNGSMRRSERHLSSAERPSLLLSSLQSTVNRVNGNSHSSGYGKSSSEPRHTHQQMYRSKPQVHPERTSSNNHNGIPLFGGILPENQPWPSGYALPSPGPRRRDSDGSMRYSTPTVPHSRSISDASVSLSPAKSHTNGVMQNGDSPHQLNGHGRSRSAQPVQIAASQDHNGYPDPILEDQENPDVRSLSQSPSRSKIPLPAYHTRAAVAEKNGSPHRHVHRRPSTPPSVRRISQDTRLSPRSASEGQKLRAFINVPAAKVSPPLRRARPHQDMHQARSVSPDPRQARSREDSAYSSASRNATPEDHRTPRQAGEAYNWENSSTRPAAAVDPQLSLPQLPTTTYRRSSRNLQVDVQDTQPASQDDQVSTATTEFEEDGIPIVHAPGSYPDSDDELSRGTTTQGSDHHNPRVPEIFGPPLSGANEDVHHLTAPYDRNGQAGDNLQSQSTLSLPGARSSLATEMTGTDAETIQIMLSQTPVNGQFESRWDQGETSQHNKRRSIAAPAYNTGRNQEQASDPSNSRWAQSPADDESINQSVRNSDYSTINRILEQYHQSGIVTDDMVHDFQQYLYMNEPELLGGEDAESVAKIALEDIIRAQSVYTASPDLESGVNNENSIRSASHWRNDSSHKTGTSDHGEGAMASAFQATAQPRHQQIDGPADSDMGPTPPPKTPMSLPMAEYSYPTPSAYDAGATSFLPETPSTGGSLGLTPGSTTHNAYQQRPTATYPPAVPNGANDHDAAITADAKLGIDAVDGAISTPASSYRQRQSFSESQRVPSSQTSVTEAGPNEHNQTITSSPASSDAVQKRLSKRRQVLKELVDTEASYMQDMKVVEDIYKATSNACDAVTSDDRRVLFGNSSQIIAFSETFLAALKRAAAPVYVTPRSNKWKPDQTSRSTSGTTATSEDASNLNADLPDVELDRKTSVGDVFNQHMARMEDIYTTYLRNQDFANQRLRRLQEAPKVKLWLNECHTYAKDITSAWDLDSLLVKPVQRVLKYPLLLKALIEVTSDDHPDYAGLQKASKDMVETSLRINESKKRADVLEQVMNNNKRKDFDIAKLLGRRTDKLRQQVGLSDAIDDGEYRKLSQMFETRYVHLQIVMRDFEVYKTETTKFMERLARIMEAVKENISVGRTSSPELESKWRKLVLTLAEMHQIAYKAHDAAVTRHCVDPILAAIKLFDGPQKMMLKRKKRVVEYAKYMTAKNKGDKPDKKTSEQGEQFLVIDETLKIELPKLLELSTKLVLATLRNFIDLLVQWHSIWQTKTKILLEDQSVPVEIAEILDAFHSDFSYVEAHVLSLGICNGSLVNDVNNYLSTSDTSISTNDSSSTTRPSLHKSYTSTGQQSPVIPAPDFDRHSGSSFNIPSFSGRPSNESEHRSQHRSQLSQGQNYYPERHRATSNVSSSSSKPAQPHATAEFTLIPSSPYIPHQESRRQQARENRHISAPQQTLPDNIVNVQSFSRPVVSQRPASTSSTFYSASQGGQPGASPNFGLQRRSGAFSSALPLSDSTSSTRPASPETTSGQREYTTLFTAASLYDFNLKQERYEGGWPYLFYSPGEIFNIIGVKGELWLAVNQDDAAARLGWVWEKHFAKLMDGQS